MADLRRASGGAYLVRPYDAVRARSLSADEARLLDVPEQEATSGRAVDLASKQGPELDLVSALSALLQEGVFTMAPAIAGDET